MDNRVHQFTGFQPIVEALRLEDFPMDKATLNYCVGDLEIRSRSGEVLRVSDLTACMSDDEFSTPEAVMRSIHEILSRSQRKIA